MYFKPACLLAVCSLVDRGVEPSSGIAAEAVVQEFERLVHPIFPEKAGNGWMPLWHLMSDAAWVCVKAGIPTPRTVFPQGKPKSRKQLLTSVDSIRLPNGLMPHWQEKSAREELKRRLCLMLSADRDEQASVAADRFAELFGLQSAAEGDASMSELQQDLTAIEAARDVTPTTRQQLIDARLGQGRFRQELEREFQERCAVTGLHRQELLRASHILAWRDSTNLQRIDPNNGLLLSANLDALFDKHLITFDRRGRVRVSSSIGETELVLLGPVHDLRCQPTPERWEYLRRHNDTFNALDAPR